MASVTVSRRRAVRRRPSVGTPLAYLAAVVIIVVTLVPLLYMVFGGFRTTAQINSSPAGLPHLWVLSNYRFILSSKAFWHYLGNSMLIASVATALAVTFGAMAAFALSRYTFRGREVVYTVFTLGLLFPL